MVDSVSSNSAAGAGSSIVSSLSGGTGVDNAKLIDQLVELSQSAEAARLTSQQTLLETQISDYGLLRSSFATLQSAAGALSDRDTFDAKAVSIPDTSLLGITKLNATAVAGDYRIKVEQIAQAQSISSGSFGSPSDPVGKGSLTLRFGHWDAANFAVGEKSGATITIDDTNNSLTGLRDAINDADIGVQATIVSDEGGYKLLLTAPSGASNEIELTATEDATDVGLANFNFNAASVAATTGLTQQQEGTDAKVRVNGLLLTRQSNHLTDVIEGMEFDIFNASASETVTINISADKATAETAIRDFVDSYNTFLTEIDTLVGFDDELGDYGSLRQDPLAKNLLQTVRSMMTGSVDGISSGFNSLSTLGIRTKQDGSLEIVENGTNTDFRAAMDKNFEAVKDFFTPKTSSSDSRITVTDFSGKSIAGSYAVEISQNAEKGSLTGDPITATFPLTTGAGDYSFDVQVDGISAASISLPAGKTYTSIEELAADMQSLINLDSAVKEGQAGVLVKVDGDHLVFTSKAYGASSLVAFTAVGANMAELGVKVDAGVAGKDVVGTIDGQAGFGFGNVLLPAIGSKAEGLSMIIEPGATSGTINFSRGFAGKMDSAINDFLKTSGLISNREANINDKIDDVKEDKETLDRRTEAYRTRLTAQFTAMESIVRSLNSTSSFLDGILDRLPFTAKK